MPVVSVVLAGLMMRSRGAIRLGMRIAFRRTTTTIGFGGYSRLTTHARECGYSVRIQCVRLHDRAICTRGSPGPDKLESVCTGCCSLQSRRDLCNAEQPATPDPRPPQPGFKAESTPLPVLPS